jgi:hypothetical protein
MRAEAAAGARRNEWIGGMKWVDREFEGEEARVWRVLSRGRDEAGVLGEARASERGRERGREKGNVGLVVCGGEVLGF